MKRRFGRIAPALLAMLMLLSLTACGGGSAKAEEAPMAAAPMGEMYFDSSTSDMAMPEAAPMEEVKGEYGGGYTPGSSNGSADGVVETGRKMIRTAELQLETTEFDAAIEGLNALTEQMGGYFENSSIGTRGSNYRWAEYTVRVPAEHYNGFLNQAGELCHETWRNASQQDVSEVYYDTAGRLKTQQIKLERLQELLSKAELMEDIITIENAISETEQRIDDLSGTLQHYDAKVDYATVYIYLNEVYKLSDVEEVPEGFGSRLGNAFTRGWSNFVDNTEDLLVSMAYSWMQLLIFAAVVVVAVVVLRRQLRKRKAKLAAKAETLHAEYVRKDEEK